MKFLLVMESNQFPKYVMGNVVDKFSDNIICRHLIVTSNFPLKQILNHLKLVSELKRIRNSKSRAKKINIPGNLNSSFLFQF